MNGRGAGVSVLLPAIKRTTGASHLFRFFFFFKNTVGSLLATLQLLCVCE